MIKKLNATASKSYVPGNGYIWRILSVYVQLTAVASSAAQNITVVRKTPFAEYLAYIPNQTSAGTYNGQGAPSNYSSANYLVSYYVFPLITYNDGIEVTMTLPTGASGTVFIILDEEPEA